MNDPNKPLRSFRPRIETCEPRLLLAADLFNGQMELGTNLDFVFQEEHTNLLSYPTGSTNPDGTSDSERRPFAFRNGVDWDSAYNFDANSGLSTTNPWRQDFLDDLEIYSQLRYIHWTNTNGSGIETWAERTSPDSDQTQLSTFGTTSNGLNNGIAWEWLIDLGNRTGKDIWINIPLKADNDYVSNLASLIHQRLDPSLSVHLEYHNEIWLQKGITGDFRTTTQYASEMATNAGIQGTSNFDSVLRWYAHRSAQIWQTFRTEFGTSFDQRVVKVLAGQTANVNVGEQIRDNIRDPAVNTTQPIELEDAYAIAPYFAALETISDPIDFAYVDGLAQAQVTQAAANVAVWNSVNTPVIAYEGGQSVTGANATDNAIAELNTDPQIHDIYLDYLEGLEQAGLESFNHFTHSGVKLAPTNNSDSFWGAKAFVGQSASEAPKFGALAEFAGIVPTESPSSLVHDGTVGTFDAAGSTTNSTEIQPHASFIPQVSTGNLVAGEGVDATNGPFNNSFAPTGWNSLTLDDAIVANEYVSFSVSVDAGYELNVNALDLILRTQNQPRNFALLSSATGFTSQSVVSDFGGPVFGNFGQQEVTVDLHQTPGLQAIEGLTEFRIYAFGGSPNAFESVGIGARNGFDLKLSAQVVQQPITTVILVDEEISAFDTFGSIRQTTTEIVADQNIVPITTSPLTSGAGVTATNSWYDDRFAPRQWTSTTLADAIASSDYISFDVNVAAGYSLDLGDIDAYLFSQNSRPREFALLSSATGFSASDAISDFGGTFFGCHYGQESRTASVNLHDLTGSTEFRIYVYGTNNTNPWEAAGLGNRSGDELTMTGTLSRISGGPEVIYSGGVTDFDTVGSIKNQTAGIAPDATSLVTASDLTPGVGLGATNGWYNDRFAPIGWNSTTLADAIANDDYLTFSLTVAPGASLALTEIDTYLFTQNQKSRTFALMSDATGFTVGNTLTDFGGPVTGAGNWGQESRTADLSTAGLTELTGTVEFRIYVYGTVNVWEAVGLGNRSGSELGLLGNITF